MNAGQHTIYVEGSQQQILKNEKWFGVSRVRVPPTKKSGQAGAGKKQKSTSGPRGSPGPLQPVRARDA